MNIFRVFTEFSCYYFGNWTETWKRAQNIYFQLGGDLVSVNDRIEKDYLDVILQSFEGTNTIYIYIYIFLTHPCRRQALKMFSSPTIVGDHF